MGRALLDVLVPFLLPFAGYAVYLVLRRRYPFVVSAWSRGPLAALVVGGLGLAVLSLHLPLENTPQRREGTHLRTLLDVSLPRSYPRYRAPMSKRSSSLGVEA